MTALSIVTTAPGDLAAPQRRYSIARTLALPAFWHGAAHTRAELRDAAGEARAHVIAKKLAAGIPLSAIPEVREWHGRGGR